MAAMRPPGDADSIRVVAVWQQARQKAVNISLSRFTCLRGVR
jgi:hypothetical protein